MLAIETGDMSDGTTGMGLRAFPLRRPTVVSRIVPQRPPTRWFGGID